MCTMFFNIFVKPYKNKKFLQQMKKIPLLNCIHYSKAKFAAEYLLYERMHEL